MLTAPTAENLPAEDWTLEILQSNLQAAVDLEFWTIPFYLSALYSVRDQTAAAYQLIRSVATQEMLHFELAGNVANAYGVQVTCEAPVYGRGIPHLDFALDKVDPTAFFTPWSSEIGPLDVARVNAMCLIEFPEWDEPVPTPELQEENYGSIGALYRAITIAAERLQANIAPRNQLDDFQRYYRGGAAQAVTQSGADGWPQVRDILTTITEQGEGQNEKDQDIPAGHRNTATDPADAVDHYGKFLQVRSSGSLPSTYSATADPPPGGAGAQAQAQLIETFSGLLPMLAARMAGETVDAFWTQMATVGSAIRTCWVQGAIPKFS